MEMINHRNVVRLYDSFTLDNNVFMCMELVEVCQKNNWDGREEKRSEKQCCALDLFA